MLRISDNYLNTLLEEDLQLMDLTVMSMNLDSVPGILECHPKKNCVLAGVEEAARLFEKTGSNVEILHPSGSLAEGGQIFMRACGTAGAFHSCWKQAQNIMEYSSGIATRTAAMLKNARTANPSVHVSVTRKHFPGGKALSIKAALAGGASIHRLGLSDSILVFEQHRVFVDDFIGLIPEMAEMFPEKKIAVEADSFEEAVAYVKAGAHVIQCERFEFDELKNFVDEARGINKNIKIAAAGGINASNAAEYAATGVDILVTSWVYFGKPEDIKIVISREK
ncbi:MAG: ModD protein [Synergistaceae bacterium]|nr:ModD protein [Synergistaceae bacterium]